MQPGSLAFLPHLLFTSFSGSFKVCRLSVDAIVYFQLIFWAGGGVLVGVMWAMTGILSAFLIGLLCIPFALVFSVLPLGAIVYGIIGGIQSYQGQNFRYWLVADWVNV
ncbi:MAG: hypothetical protein HC806_06105 [Anaerolineae bacterium]|nr:hypothetical protein [Anaerolineae bacterium]